MENNYVYEKPKDSLVKEGDYEARIESVEKKVLPSGKEKLSIRFRLRDDVGQAYGNKVVFEDIWSERDNPQFFNRRRINQLLGTQNIADGTRFDSIDDIVKFITGACLIVHIAIVFDDYRGEEVNTISFYRSSKNKPQTIASTTTTQVETKTGGVVVSNEDLPF